MSFLSRIFGSEGGKKPDEIPAMPWDQHPSIFEFVSSHIAEDKPGMTQEGEALPDEEPVRKGSHFRWAAGARDGVTTHHESKSENEEKARKIVELVATYAAQPTATNKAAVYSHIVDQQIVTMIDPVIQALVNEEGIDQNRLYELARSFVTESPDREPIKFGIAILGLFQHHADQELFQTLGRHDEFTLFCAVALANAGENSEESLWNLARNVYGWGRIHVVERLANTANPAIKDWLLREGFRNSVMYEYLAGICATAGGLLAALSEPHVDREILTSASQILQALISGGPVEGIDGYEDAPPVLELFLDQMAARAETIGDFLYVDAIKGYLDREDSRWGARSEQAWSNERREKLREICNSILRRSEWIDRIRAALGSVDDTEFFHADQAAKAIGIDTWEIHWQRLQHKPADPGRWYDVMLLCNEDRIGRVIAFAERNIDLGSIATGAAHELGLGREFEKYSCLGFVLQELNRFPGRGAKLIDAGLRSPVVRNRSMAAAALAAWSGEGLPSELKNSLERAAEYEPDEGVRDRMQRVLRGEPLTQ
jgi:hypothetical protein